MNTLTELPEGFKEIHQSTQDYTANGEVISTIKERAISNGIIVHFQFSNGREWITERTLPANA